MLVTPLLDGQDLFGVSVQMVTGSDPRRVTINSYCGVNGEEAIDCGGGGRFTSVSGRTFQPDLGSLATYRGLLESFVDGLVHTLLDTSGTTWGYVMMIESPKWSRRWTRDSNGFTQSYELLFKHLN
jgi:hypothetical protein